LAQFHRRRRIDQNENIDILPFYGEKSKKISNQKRKELIYEKSFIIILCVFLLMNERNYNLP